MRRIKFLLKKEFLQVFRNRAILPIVFILPVIQLLILAHAATYEIRNISLTIVDNDNSQLSRQLAGHFDASPYFILDEPAAPGKSLDRLYSDRADMVLHIPNHFERDLLRDRNAKVLFSINAINSSKAAVAYNYAQSILQQFNRQILAEWSDAPAMAAIRITFANWFNPELNYITYMVPGILVLLVTIIGMFLSSINIVREKEMGTIEQINVTPVSKGIFIIGKLTPFWVIAMIELVFGMAIAKLFFRIPIEGSLGLIFAFAAVYLLVVLGLGLLISTVSETQYQAMFLTWFFMVVFILMSGLLTPIESMPTWAQELTRINPIAYFVRIIRMVMLKGSAFSDIAHDFLFISIFAVVVNLLAVINYRKTV